MTTLHPPTTADTSHIPPARPAGWMGRLGAWTATHLKAVLLAWAAVVVAFGFFAPKVQSSLAGAGDRKSVV